MKIVTRKVPDRWTALGLAAHFVAKHDTFGRFPAADLIRTLDGQIRRGHFLFAFDVSTEPARVVGYLGWALYDEEEAERFAASSVPPSRERADGGNVLWILTATAVGRVAFFALLKVARALYPAHRVMGVRHKSGGRKVVFDKPRASAAAGERAQTSQ